MTALANDNLKLVAISKGVPHRTAQELPGVLPNEGEFTPKCGASYCGSWTAVSNSQKRLNSWRSTVRGCLLCRWNFCTSGDAMCAEIAQVILRWVGLSYWPGCENREKKHTNQKHNTNNKTKPDRLFCTGGGAMCAERQKSPC